MIRTLALAGAALAATATLAHAQMPAPSTADYVAQAGASDKFEIEEARLAERRSHNPRVLAFARMMVRDHTKSTHMIVAAATQSMGHAPPPPMLTDQQRDNLRDLRAASPRDFNRVYMTQQAAAHHMALDLHRNYAQNGNDPALKQVASQIVPVVQMHLDKADQLANSLS